MTSPEQHVSRLTLMGSPWGDTTSWESSIILRAISAIWTAWVSLSLCKPPATQYASPIVSTYAQQILHITKKKNKKQKPRKHHSVHHRAEITSWSRNLSFMGQWNIRVNHRFLVFLSRKLTRFLSWKAVPCCEYSVRRGVCSQTCHWFPHITAPLSSRTM